MESEIVVKKKEKESYTHEEVGKILKEDKEKEIDLFNTEALPGIGPIGKKKLDEAGVISYFDLCIRGSMEIREIKRDNRYANGQNKISNEYSIRRSTKKGSHTTRHTRPISINEI